MRLTEIWSSRTKPTVSFELFPAHTPKSQAKLEQVITELVALEPDFFSVTFGAGGSTREGSRALVEKLKHGHRREVLAYFAGYGLGPDEIRAVLDEYTWLGVQNMLVVRGDPPAADSGFVPHDECLAHASDMLRFVGACAEFCLGAAGYPEGHKEAQSKEQDLEYLKLKVKRGASFIITQYFYDNRFFFDFLERCRAQGISVPIIPGVMPIFSVKMMESLAALCGATITAEVRQAIAALPEGDKGALLELGIELATRQCRELIEAGVPGIHIYTMDRSESARGIVTRLREAGLL